MGKILVFFSFVFCVSKVYAQCAGSTSANIASAYSAVQTACTNFLISNPGCTCVVTTHPPQYYANGMSRTYISGITTCGLGGGATGSGYFDLCPEMIPSVGSGGAPAGADGGSSGSGGAGSGGGSSGSGGSGPGCKNSCCGSSGGSAGASGSEAKSGSIIDIDFQSLGEEIPLVGVPFSLMYNTTFVRDRVGFYDVRIPVSNADLYVNTTGFDIKIFNEAGSQVDNQSFPAAINQTYNWSWNGNLDNGTPAMGALPYKIRRTELATSGNMVRETAITVGHFQAIRLGLGHWVPSIYKFYDSYMKRMVFPNGTSRDIQATWDAGAGLYKVSSQDSNEFYEFNSTGRLVTIRTGVTAQVVWQFSYDGSGQLSQIQDGFANTTTFNRNGSGEWISITTPYSKTITTPLDANLRLEEVIFPSGDKYEMTYHGTGALLATFEKPNLATSTFTYDASGNLIQDAHSGGFTQNLTNLLRTTHLTKVEYSNSSQTNKITVSNDVRTESRSVTEPSKPTKSVYYSAASSSVVDGGGITKTVSRSNDLRFGVQAKRITSIQGTEVGSAYRPESYTQSVTLSTPSNPFSISAWTKTKTVGTSVVTSVYNPSLKKWTSTTSLGATSNYTFDTHERIIQSQQGSLNAVDLIYSGDKLTQIIQGTRTTTMAYSLTDGLLTSITDPLSQVTSYTYDSNERVSSITRPDTQVINMSYNSVGQLASITPVSKPAHTFSFGTNELTSTYTPPSILGVVTPQTAYTYDNNRIKTITRPDGKVITYNYNAATGLLSSVVTAEATITPSFSATTAMISNMTSPTRFGIYYSYAGKIPSAYYTYTPAPATHVSTYTRGFNANYGFVNTDTVSGASGSSTINYTYNNDQKLSVAGDIALAYNTPNGQLTTATMGTNVMTNTYNNYGELLTQTTAISGTPVHDLTLTYDAAGRIDTKKDTLPSVVTPTYEYTYDNLGRLTSVDDGATNLSTYTYDLNGNRTQKVQGLATTNYTYDDQDRLLTAGVYTFTYNDQGEMLTKTNTLLSQTTTYTYDSLGNLTQVALPGGTTITYEIDVQNRRVGKRVNGTLQTRYVYADQYRIIGETDASSALKRRYVYASKGNIPDYYIESSVKYRILSDQLGSPRVVINHSTGATIAEFDHDEFGVEVANTAPALKLAFGFAGGLYDADTGLLRFGARDYDPTLGRWLSKDPILFNGKDANLYGYTWNNPVNFIDPKGTVVQILPAMGWGAGIGGAIGFIGGWANAPSNCNFGGKFMNALVAGAGGALGGAAVGFGAATGTGGAFTSNIISTGMGVFVDMGATVAGHHIGYDCSPPPPPRCEGK